VASSGSTFSKMQREREKKERAAAKREARQNKSAATDAGTDTSTIVAGEGDLSAADLVRLVEAINKEYEDGTIDIDEFEEKKQALLARVRID
jgi:hypothetical protein